MGIVTILLHRGAGVALFSLLQFKNASASSFSTSVDGVFILVYYLLSLVSLYLAHSGLASLRIGLMRIIGYEIPERYRFPFLAVSPADFWRRWNIYLGSWAKRYVFYPVATFLSRRWGGSRTDLSTAIAVLVAFMTIGILHDFVYYTQALISNFAGTSMFLLQGIAVLLWIAVSRGGWGVIGNSAKMQRVLYTGSVTVSRTAFFALLVFIAWAAESYYGISL
jgi:hypothetical protein